MIRTLDEVISKRAEISKSIDKLNAENYNLRTQSIELSKNPANKEVLHSIYKRRTAIEYKLQTLRGMKQALDFMINYDSEINAEPTYIAESTLYNLDYSGE